MINSYSTGVNRPRPACGGGGVFSIQVTIAKAGFCPDRRQRNQLTGETKSAAGKRVIGLPDELVALLNVHREEQDRERRAAGQLWREGGWVFTFRRGTD
ncbi:MAG: hypothetical protein ABIQ15_11030 [Nocardioides sp.]